MAQAAAKQEPIDLRKAIMSRLNMSIEGPTRSSRVAKNRNDKDNYGEDDGLTEE